MTTKSGIKAKNGDDFRFGLGWQIAVSGSQVHTGSMNGTVSLAVGAGGVAYTALVNRNPGGDQYGIELSDVLDEIVAGISAWPAHDLF